MGTYNLGGEEIKDKFKDWLYNTSSGHGDITADAIAKAWNLIAKEEQWNDRLKASFINEDKYCEGL